MTTTNVENSESTSSPSTLPEKMGGIVVAKVVNSNREQIFNDLTEMIQYATSRGILLPSDVQLDGGKTEATLIASYNSMVKTIEPATVQSIRYIRGQILGGDRKNNKWHQTPIIVKCLFIACIGLVSLIGFSLSPDVNSENQAEGLLSADGLILFYNLMFICSASLLGVMFFLLKTIGDKIKDYSLLPIDTIKVNSTIIIGIISGFILSELFRFNVGTLGSTIEVQKMTLALIGGFSSDAIFSVLKGVVNKLKSLFSTEAGGG